MQTKFLAVGGAHWDILGRSAREMSLYDDVPGRVERVIGGVAGPIAMKLGQLGAYIALMAYAGHDEFGEALLAKLTEYAVDTKPILRGKHPTDVYLGIEAPNGLIAAIADCHSLEAVSPKIYQALQAVDLERTHLILDGNLRSDMLRDFANSDIAPARLTLIPASPGKIDRFVPFLARGDAELIVNLREANTLLNAQIDDAAGAASKLVEIGLRSALVSNGGEPTAFADANATVSALPPQVEIKRFTGAGDTLSAHFLFAAQNQPPQIALETALAATAQFISQEVAYA